MKKSRIIKVIIGLLLVYFVVIYFDVDIIDSYKSLKSPGYLYLSLFIPLLINPYISNNRWKVLLAVQGINEGFLNLVRISFVSLFLGIMLPATSGSDAFRIYHIERKNKGSKGSGAASVIIERLLGFFLLSILGLGGGIYAVKNGAPDYILFLSIAVHLILVIILCFFKITSLHNFINSKLSGISRGRKIITYINSVYASINQFPLRKVFIPTVILIIAFQISTIFCGFLIFSAFNVHIPFYYHLAFLPLIQIISIIPISISGLGIREGGFVYFYNLVGVEARISFMVSILYYTILVLVPAFIGMILYFIDQLKPNKRHKIK